MRLCRRHRTALRAFPRPVPWAGTTAPAAVPGPGDPDGADVGTEVSGHGTYRAKNVSPCGPSRPP